MKVRMVRKFGKYFITETGCNTMDIFYGCRHSCLTDWQSNENKCDVPRTWVNIYFNGPKLVYAFSVSFFSQCI